MEKDKMKERKPCPLSREEWLDFLKTYLFMKKFEVSNNLNTILTFTMLIIAILIPFIVVGLNLGLKLDKTSHAFLLFSLLLYFVMIVGVFSWWVWGMRKIDGIKKESNAIHEIIKKIISGELVKSDEIREEWDKIEKKEYPDIMITRLDRKDKIMKTEEKRFILSGFIVTILSGLLVNIFVVAYWDLIKNQANVGLIAISAWGAIIATLMAMVFWMLLATITCG